MEPATPLPDLSELREEYGLAGLTEDEVSSDGIEQLSSWLDQAREAGLYEPNAFVLSTVSATGLPSSRTVLAKGLDERGLVFYTNYSSRKGEELAGQPGCAALFGWYPLQRQARIEGTALKLTEEESAAYFLSRPKPSQLGAWASPQSKVVAHRAVLETAYEAAERRFTEHEMTLPPFWGGYRIEPRVIELWQGRRGRLHDRLRYTYSPTKQAWALDRLAP